MSEELRNILTRESQVSRLKFLTSDPVVIPPGSVASPSLATIVLRYPGPGVFTPQALMVGGFNSFDGSTVNPSAKNFTFTVKTVNGKIILHGKQLYNQQDFTASNNFLAYFDNFDSYLSLGPTDWWYVDIMSYYGPIIGGFHRGCTLHVYSIGTEFLM